MNEFTAAKIEKLQEEIGEATINMLTDNSAQSFLKMIDLKDKLGDAYMEAEDYDEARTSYQDALNGLESLGEIMDLTGLEPIEAQYTFDLALVDMEQEHYKDALPYLLKAESLLDNYLKESDDLQAQGLLAAVHNSLGIVYFDEGDFETALKNYKLTLDYEIQRIERDDRPKVLRNLTNSYIKVAFVEEKLDNYEEAVKYYQKACDNEQLLMAKVEMPGNFYAAYLHFVESANELAKKGMYKEATEEYFNAIKACRFGINADRLV